MTLQVRAMKLVALLTAVAGVVACDDDDPSGPTIVSETFRATMNGASERPNPVNTNANGTATVVIFGASADSISYEVKVAQIDSVRLSHIHAGDANTAGSIIFGFANTVPPTSFTALTTLQQGVIKRTSTFSGIFTYDSLVTRLRAGTSYVNVHTVRFGGGEIRGNLIKQ